MVNSCRFFVITFTVITVPWNHSKHPGLLLLEMITQTFALNLSTNTSSLYTFPYSYFPNGNQYTQLSCSWKQNASGKAWQNQTIDNPTNEVLTQPEGVWKVHIFLALSASQPSTSINSDKPCYKIYKFNFTKLEILNNGLYLM